MPQLNTKDYKGSERRGGNCKLKLTFGEYLKLFTLIGGAIVAGIVSWIALQGDVRANAQDIAEASTDIKETIKIDIKQDKVILTLQNNVSAIKNHVSDIKVTQEESQKILYKILGKLEPN